MLLTKQEVMDIHLSTGDIYELAEGIERAVLAKAGEQGPVEWFYAKDKLPDPDTEVWVCVKNKNKQDGIWLHDICWHDGDKWGKREHTWEDIVLWAYPVDPFLKRSLPAKSIKEEKNYIGANTGHGHVWERPDGMKAKCGGPSICSACAKDKAAMGSYSHPLPAQAIPEGWKLVPVNPTESQRQAMYMAAHFDMAIENPDEWRAVDQSYAAMLSASPKP
jgi:hypothetical protein